VSLTSQMEWLAIESVSKGVREDISGGMGSRYRKSASRREINEGIGGGPMPSTAVPVMQDTNKAR